MLVREILDASDDFPVIRTDATVLEAATTMRDADVRAVPVVEGDRLLGIVTDWDMVEALADHGDELSAKPVSAIMTSSDLVTIDLSATAAAATSRLQENRVHHLPVLDGERYVGMICLGLEWNEDDMLTPPVRPALTARRP